MSYREVKVFSPEQINEAHKWIYAEWEELGFDVSMSVYGAYYADDTYIGTVYKQEDGSWKSVRG